MEHFFPFLMFAITSSLTPGPNNIMLMASGVNFGVRKTIPHFLGVLLGFPAFLLVIGLGLGTVFETFPMVHHVIKVVGAAYMFYLAWHIANAHAHAKFSQNMTAKPLRFIDAFLFQWVNPKAWVMAVGSIATYTSVPANTFIEIIYICLTFTMVLLPSGSTWLLFGTALKRILKNDFRQRIFNYVMGSLLALSVVLIFV